MAKATGIRAFGVECEFEDANAIKTSAKVTSISEQSTDAQIPTAKAVYDKAIEILGGGGTVSGTLNITSNGEYDISRYAKVVVHLTDAEPCTEISLDKSAITITSLATSDVVRATTTPTYPTDKIIWSTSDAEKVSIVDNEDGSVTVTSVSNGIATITATCGTQTAECSVTVNAEAWTDLELANTFDYNKLTSDGKASSSYDKVYVYKCLGGNTYRAKWGSIPTTQSVGSGTDAECSTQIADYVDYSGTKKYSIDITVPATAKYLYVGCSRSKALTVTNVTA